MPKREISTPTPDVAFERTTSLRDTLGSQVEASKNPDTPTDSKPRRVKQVGSDPAKVNENAVTVAPGATKQNVS